MATPARSDEVVIGTRTYCPCNHLTDTQCAAIQWWYDLVNDVVYTYDWDAAAYTEQPRIPGNTGVAGAHPYTRTNWLNLIRRGRMWGAVDIPSWLTVPKGL